MDNQAPDSAAIAPEQHDHTHDETATNSKHNSKHDSKTVSKKTTDASYRRRG